MAVILEEEKIIIESVSNYGSLLELQLIKYLKHKKEEVSERIIAGLKKRNFLYSKEAGYVTVDPRERHDIKTINAFWVLLEFIDDLDYRQHFPGNYPSQIYFIANEKEYEIVVIDDGEAHLINLYKQQYYDDQKTTIIVVPDVAMVDTLPDLTGPVIYATVTTTENNVEVVIYKTEE